MLSLLHIENIAVIEQADIAFGRGFHVLTGETGAGKSIVIDAICAILGERTYRDVIRTGAERAFVSAVFTDVPELAWFAENGVEYTPDELLVQREMHADGRTVCRVNGRPVTAAILRQLGTRLISIHGQHDSRQLFDESSHLNALDLFAHDAELLERYSQAYAAMRKTAAERERLCMDESEKLRLVESLRYQIDEISRAELTAGEEDALEERRGFLRNAEKMTEGVENALFALCGGDSDAGAEGLLSEAARVLSRLSHADAAMQGLQQRLSELSFAARDCADELRSVRDGLSDPGAELEGIEARLDVLYRLKRKYGADTAAVLDYLENARRRLNEIEFADGRRAELDELLKKQTEAAKAAAQALHEARVSAAERFRERMERELSQLDMPKVRFSCRFTPCELGESGADSVCFLLSANVGEALKPLNKIASGGELARIMLALKNVMAERDPVATLIFDEVDAGVSGRAAQKVAQKLAAVSKEKQVLCVTHLPQLAAMADTHFLVEKRVENERTYTDVRELDTQARQRELARITGGAVLSPVLLQGAAELLQAAEAFKAGRK